MPKDSEVLGVVVRLLGYDRVLVKCTDGNTRMCRIPGKMKRKVWIKDDDIVLVEPWDFQSDTRGDVIWRYTKGGVTRLRNKGYLINI